MWNDPIVEEIHEIRKKLLEQAGGDLHEIIRQACVRQKAQKITLQGKPRIPSSATLIPLFTEVSQGISANSAKS
jgi:hypothetical protein